MSEQDHGREDTATALLELLALLLSAEHLEAALRHLAEMAVAVIPDGPSCGITARSRALKRGRCPWRMTAVGDAREGLIPAAAPASRQASAS
jgi:hypothetical protein